jgi:hypothetical protein
MVFFSHTRAYARICLVAAVGGFFVWIFNENIPIAGVKKISYTFGIPSGAVTQLRPMARIEEGGKEHGILYQTIREDPVFFDVRTPVTYNTLVVEILYKNNTNRPFGLGIKEFPTQLNFFVTPFESVGAQEGWVVGRAEISLNGIRRMPGKYSLSLSVKGLEYHPERNEGVRVSKMNIILKRKPLLSL